MAIQNIKILMLLFSLGSYYSIQALVIRGVDIPTLDPAKLAGRWHVIGEYIENLPLECTTTLVTPLSNDKFAVNITYRLLPVTRGNDSNVVRIVTESNTVTLDVNPYVKSKDDNGDDVVEVAFDVDYESYLVMYVTSSVEELSDGQNGYIYIISRKPTLAEGILEKTEQSVFYKEGLKPGLSFIPLNAEACLEYI